jgi:lysophospholipase L1-like esterase
MPIILIVWTLLLSGCTDNDSTVNQPDRVNIKYLALGDSYTIGESVCVTCRFPAQLADSLQSGHNYQVSTNIIAQTGWTTTNLKSAIAAEAPATDYDLVTLLIGVNNQFQHRPFSLYETEFPELVNIAISHANGNKNNVVVLSIPDYAYTPYGQGSSDPQEISDQIDAYNAFAENYCNSNDIKFVNITDITRNGLSNPALVADDGLHPSEDAYELFVEEMIDDVLEALN